MRVAVVGHVEWVHFARLHQLPRAGEIVHAWDPFEEPAGGGAVAAVQLARLAGGAVLVTALGDDELGRRAATRLAELGVELWMAWRGEPTRRATTLVDERGERTIVTLGPRHEPLSTDGDIPWESLGEMDAVYFTAGDAGALAAARAARVLVASPRAQDALGHGVELDGLVLSERDASERREASEVEGQARAVVRTEGASGGVYSTREGATGSWPVAPAPATTGDSYGCGDSFAAGLTYGLGAGMELERGLALAARCGATCLGGRGPYERQLSAADLSPAERRDGRVGGDARDVRAGA
ncbi:MAG TPA: PfkB family carbohydrate kinase [Solirubrobacteraceae bacterium]|nr:PfkB family carbohydrate kinase [Solirubrobacteraceae bacterium]